jgi:hypothetical protein
MCCNSRSVRLCFSVTIFLWFPDFYLDMDNVLSERLRDMGMESDNVETSKLGTLVGTGIVSHTCTAQHR